MIRQLEWRDIPRLRELQTDFHWDIDSAFLVGMVMTDEHDNPVMIAGAWRLAEVHAVVDKNWSTPGARLVAMKQLHDAMGDFLKQQGYKQAVTWFDSAKECFTKRLTQWGWIESKKTSWHRSING